MLHRVRVHDRGCAGLLTVERPPILVKVLLWLAAFVGIMLLYFFPPHAYGQIPRDAETYRREYTRIIRSEWGLDAPVSSLAAQIHQESRWDCKAVSRVGAGGCAQFMPRTAAWIGDVDHRLRDGDIYSPAWGFRAQGVYMRWLHDRVKGPVPCEQMAFALAAYNGGLGYVYKRQKLSKTPLICLGSTCELNPGIKPSNQNENAHYPRRILLELEPRYESAGWGLGSC
jgi:hypothetical protein